MPKNQQNISKSKGRKAVKEEKIRKIALSDDDALYGRVIKSLGQRQFRIILPDASMRLIEVTAKIPKKRSLITESDIVVVATSGTAYEIQGTMDKKTAHTLAKEKRLHPDLLVAGDWDSTKKEVVKQENDGGIEFDYDGLETKEGELSEEDDDDEEKGEKELNIDDI
jgi:translation initiation factor IF-1